MVKHDFTFMEKLRFNLKNVQRINYAQVLRIKELIMKNIDGSMNETQFKEQYSANLVDLKTNNLL